MSTGARGSGWRRSPTRARRRARAGRPAAAPGRVVLLRSSTPVADGDGSADHRGVPSMSRAPVVPFRLRSAAVIAVGTVVVASAGPGTPARAETPAPDDPVSVSAVVVTEDGA